MMRASILVAITICLQLAGCAGLSKTAPYPGEPEQNVVARLGEPTHRYQDGQDRLLEYATGPYGQHTHMARVNQYGQVVSYEQVLTQQKFQTIKVGEANKEQVLRTIGAPGETSFLSLPQLEVWTYAYKESGVWDSLMHVHFDRSGIVRKMENGPDRRRDPEQRLRFGAFRIP